MLKLHYTANRFLAAAHIQSAEISKSVNHLSSRINRKQSDDLNTRIKKRKKRGDSFLCLMSTRFTVALIDSPLSFHSPIKCESPGDNLSLVIFCSYTFVQRINAVQLAKNSFLVFKIIRTIVSVYEVVGFCLFFFFFNSANVTCLKLHKPIAMFLSAPTKTRRFECQPNTAFRISSHSFNKVTQYFH